MNASKDYSNSVSTGAEAIARVRDLHEDIKGATFKNMRPSIRAFVDWYTSRERLQSNMYYYYRDTIDTNAENDHELLQQGS